MKTYYPPGPIPAPPEHVKAGAKFVINAQFSSTCNKLFSSLAPNMRLLLDKYPVCREFIILRNFTRKFICVVKYRPAYKKYALTCG